MPTEREHHAGPFIFSTDPDLTQKPSVGTKWYSPAEIQSREIISYERPQDKMALDIRIDRGTISILGRLVLFLYAVLMGCVTLVFAESIMHASLGVIICMGITFGLTVIVFYMLLGSFTRAANDITFNSVRSGITKMKPILDKVPIAEYVENFPCEEDKDRVFKTETNLKN